MKGNGACTEPLGGWEQVCSACLQAVKLGLMRRSHRRQILDWHERLFDIIIGLYLGLRLTKQLRSQIFLITLAEKEKKEQNK